MGASLIGRKIGMSQIFDDNGLAVPVTVIELGPCVVTDIKTDLANEETSKSSGYNAIQIGFEDIAERKVSSPLKGVFKKAGVDTKRHLREFRVENASDAQGYELGQVLDLSAFDEVSHVDVEGTSKGRGFAGVFKRWNFTGAKEASHGSHEKFRHGGAIGQSAYPGRVMKNKKMAGHHGNTTKSSIHLKVAKLVPEQGYMLVKGSIPGPNNGIVMVHPSKRS
jgi:large subunit ribosomal protein L3